MLSLNYIFHLSVSSSDLRPKIRHYDEKFEQCWQVELKYERMTEEVQEKEALLKSVMEDMNRMKYNTVTEGFKLHQH